MINQIIFEYAQEAVKKGFRVFISESGNYGFFTDKEGKKVISFGNQYGVIKLSGNYKTNMPYICGTGWGIYGYKTPEEAYKEYAPNWATQESVWSYTTLEQYLETYQKSSKFIELEEEIP